MQHKGWTTEWGRLYFVVYVFGFEWCVRCWITGGMIPNQEGSRCGRIYPPLMWRVDRPRGKATNRGPHHTQTLQHKSMIGDQIHFIRQMSCIWGAYIYENPTRGLIIPRPSNTHHWLTIKYTYETHVLYLRASQIWYPQTHILMIDDQIPFINIPRKLQHHTQYFALVQTLFSIKKTANMCLQTLAVGSKHFLIILCSQNPLLMEEGR